MLASLFIEIDNSLTKSSFVPAAHRLTPEVLALAVIHPLPLLTLALCAGGAFIFAMRYDPMRLSGRLTALFARGAALAGLWNLLTPWQHVAVNGATLLLTGWLGLPGAALSAFLQLV